MTEAEIEREIARTITSARHLAEGTFAKLSTTRALKVAIVGSRKGIKQGVVERFVNGLARGTIIISGGARGVDTYAARAARNCGLELFVIRPDWKRGGRGAGFKRNIEIVKECDILVAFWDGNSRGTAHTIRAARQLGVPYVIHSCGYTINEDALEGGVSGLHDQTRATARNRTASGAEQRAVGPERPPVGTTRRPRSGSHSSEQAARDLGQTDCLAGAGTGVPGYPG